MGVNQRGSNSPSARRSRNAVSDRFISPARRCIQTSLRGFGSTQTAAGLPPKTVSVKASTCVTIMRCRAAPENAARDAAEGIESGRDGCR